MSEYRILFTHEEAVVPGATKEYFAWLADDGADIERGFGLFLCIGHGETRAAACLSAARELDVSTSTHWRLWW
jgi:hypothetical protein